MKKFIQNWLQSATIASWSFGIALLVTMFVASGCKTTKTTTKTEIHTEVETDSTYVDVQYDSTGVDMSKQLSVNDKLKTSGQVEIDETIETTSIAATDSTPAMTTTNTKRRIKYIQDETREIDTNVTQDCHATTVSNDSTAVASQTKANEDTETKVKVKEKRGMAQMWPLYLLLALLVTFVVVALKK